MEKFDKFRIEPTAGDCYKIFVNDMEIPYVKHITIDIDAEYRVPIVKVEVYGGEIEGTCLERAHIHLKWAEDNNEPA